MLSIHEQANMSFNLFLSVLFVDCSTNLQRDNVSLACWVSWFTSNNDRTVYTAAQEESSSECVSDSEAADVVCVFDEEWKVQASGGGTGGDRGQMTYICRYDMIAKV